MLGAMNENTKQVPVDIDPPAGHDPFNADPVEQVEQQLNDLRDMFERLVARVERAERANMSVDEMMLEARVATLRASGFTEEQASALVNMQQGMPSKVDFMRLEAQINRLGHRVCEESTEANDPLKLWGPYIAAILPHAIDIVEKLLRKPAPPPTWTQRLGRKVFGTVLGYEL